LPSPAEELVVNPGTQSLHLASYSEVPEQVRQLGMVCEQVRHCVFAMLM
jgi:hypothetical protein